MEITKFDRQLFRRFIASIIDIIIVINLSLLVFLVIKTYEYTGKILHGHTITDNLFWSFYYTMTGLHALHVIGGMVIMALISFDIRKGHNFQRVELVGIYWHFVDLVWIFLFPLLYIANF